MLAVAAIVLGILFGVGVIGNRHNDIQSPDNTDASHWRPGYNGEDAVYVNGVGYEPNSVTTETVVVNTTGGARANTTAPTNTVPPRTTLRHQLHFHSDDWWFTFMTLNNSVSRTYWDKL